MHGPLLGGCPAPGVSERLTWVSAWEGRPCAALAAVQPSLRGRALVWTPVSYFGTRAASPSGLSAFLPHFACSPP